MKHPTSRATRPSGCRAPRTYHLDVPHASHDVVEVAEAFATVARTLAEDRDDLQSVLQKIVHLAVDTLDACQFAGISLVEQRKITSPASSNDIPKKVDEIQSELGEGPCIDAIDEQHTVYVEDLASETRWPAFAHHAVEYGMASMLSFRLFIEENESGERTMGALNLYSCERAAFDESAHEVGLVLASHASVALAGAQALAEEKEQVAGLQQAVASRDVIGQAKGILMERERLTADQAFDVLRRASQHVNLKLRDVAERVTETGERPPTPG